jgi:hypothetical protein
MNQPASSPSPRTRLMDVLVEGVRTRLAEVGEPAPSELGEGTRLVGERAVIGSLALVSLIVELEQTVEDEWGLVLTLADERAMSQTHSPFRTIGTLATYAADLIAESSAA